MQEQDEVVERLQEDSLVSGFMPVYPPGTSRCDAGTAFACRRQTRSHRNDTIDIAHWMRFWLAAALRRGAGSGRLYL
jgi:hypothetical protein